MKNSPVPFRNLCTWPAPYRWPYLLDRLELLRSAVEDLSSYVHSAPPPWEYGTLVHVQRRIAAAGRLLDSLPRILPKRTASR